MTIPGQDTSFFSLPNLCCSSKRATSKKNLAPVRKSRCPYEMETNALKSTKNQSLDWVNCSLETSIMNAVNQREKGLVPVNVLKMSLCQIV